MNEQFTKARKDAEEAEKRAKDLLSQLQQQIRQCKHVWTDGKYDPIIHPGGYSPGDPVGTMGVDWRGPSSWPERREPRWSRECTICGTKEYTTKTVPDPSAQRPQFSH